MSARENAGLYRRGVTCQITAFEVPNPPSDPDSSERKWLAIATSHVYDPEVEVPGLDAARAAIVGETMRVFDGRAFGDTEAQAMRTALDALLFELTGQAHPDDHDVEP